MDVDQDSFKRFVRDFHYCREDFSDAPVITRELWSNPFSTDFNKKIDEKGSDNIRALIPKGTKIYHGSLNPITGFMADKSIYFSIYPNIDISLWIIVEHYISEDVEERRGKMYGYLYEFELTEDLPVLVADYLSPDELWTGSGEHERNEQIMCHQRIPCFQMMNIPKPSLNEDCRYLSGEGFELIMPYSFATNYLRLTQVYLVNLQTLIPPNCASAESLNPRLSIIPKGVDRQMFK